MQADLHQEVLETYRKSILKRRTQREAFDLAAELLCAQLPAAKPAEARRLVAKMLCHAPFASHGNRRSSSVLTSMEFPE